MTTTGGSSVGLGIVILAVGLLMGGLAAWTLRSLWGRAPQPPPGVPAPGRPAAPMRPLHPLLRAVLSVDFGCLALVAAVLIVLGLVVLLRAAFG